MHDGALETWDPTNDPSSPRETTNEDAAAEQRRRLFNVRDRLQRAMIVGGQYDVVERSNYDDPQFNTDPYTPASAAKHKVIAEDSSLSKMTVSARRLTADLMVSKDLDHLRDGSPGGAGGDETPPVGGGDPGLMSCSTQSSIAPFGRRNDAAPGGAFDKPITFASNTATSILLSRQFEALSRKDLMLEQANQFNLLTHTFFQSTRWRMQQDFLNESRRLASEVEDIRQEEANRRSLFAQNLVELENSCRRRMEALEVESTSRMDMEISRAFDVLRSGQSQSRRNWVEQQEERQRNTLILDADRQMSRLMGVQMSDAQGISVQHLLRDNIPHTATGLAISKGSQMKEADDRKQQSTAEDKQHGGGFGGSDALGADGFAQPSVPADFCPDDADASSIGDMSESSERKNIEMLARFTPYWGWMCKSSGVLMTWQKRFFVFTQRGKLRYSTTSEKGPWTTLISAPNILRVEVDSYHDSSHGVRPPSDQYHQYGFYVDISDSKTNRQQRVRFCCFSRQELNNWLTVLRDATDIVYNLEHMGAIARSPYRRRLDPQVVEHLMHTQVGQGKGHVSLNSYRKRAQFEDDLAALEAQRVESEKQAIEKERLEKDGSPQRHIDGSPFHGRSASPPTSAFK